MTIDECNLVVFPGAGFVVDMVRPPPQSTLFPYTTLFRSPLRHDPFAPFSAPTVLSSVSAIQFWLGCRMLLTIWESGGDVIRSEEHTSELQSRENLVCRLLLEKKKKNENKDDTVHQAWPSR